MTIQSRSVFFALFLFISGPLQAAIITYLNEPDWLLALSGQAILYEEFSGKKSSFSANSSANALGPLSVSLIGGIRDSGPTGLTGKGFFQGEVDSEGDDALLLKFLFAPTYGFALTDLQNDSVDVPQTLQLDELAIAIGTEHWLLGDLSGSDSNNMPFLGFVSDQPVDSFTLFHAALVSPITRTSEEFYLDGFSLAIAPSSVSEPPVTMLLLVGLVAYFRVSRTGRGGKVNLARKSIS